MSHTSTSFEVRAFWIEEERHARASVLVVHGDADLHSAPELRERLRMVVDDEEASLVVDLSDASFVDSTALGVLLAGMKRFRGEGRQMRLVAPRGDIRRIFELTLLDHVLPLDESREDALRAISGGAA